MRRRPILGLVVAAALLAGCATRFVNTWKSPEWSGPPLRSVLVVGVGQGALARRFYEDAIAARLAQIGVQAEPSYRQAPGDILEAEAIAQVVVAGGHDGMIAARLVSVDHRETYMPGGPMVGSYIGWRTWGGFYPGYVRVEPTARIETQVWTLADPGTMVWAGLSANVNPRKIPGLVDSLADATVAALQQAGVLPAGALPD